VFFDVAEKTMKNVNLGIVYEPHPAELDELSAALSAVTQEQPVREIVFGFAGPNEVVQLIIDAATWQNALLTLSTLFGGKFAASFATELGKLSAAEVWKNRANYTDAIRSATAAPFVRIANAISELRKKEQTVTIAVRIPGTHRNAGLVITTDDPADIAWQFSNVARCAPRILDAVERHMEANPNTWLTGRNPDLSIEIKITRDGNIEILGEEII